MLPVSRPGMELKLLGTKGIPEGSIVSIKVGTVRRQAPIGSGRPYKFAGLNQGKQQMKVEVYAPVAQARLLIEPCEARCCVQLEGARSAALDKGRLLGVQDMALDFAVSDALSDPAANDNDNDAISVQGVPSRPSSATTERPSSATSERNAARRHQVALEAQPYFEQHHLMEVMQALLQSVIKEKPLDPYSYMIRVLENSRNAAAGATPQPQPQRQRPASAQARTGPAPKPLQSALRPSSSGRSRSKGSESRVSWNQPLQHSIAPSIVPASPKFSTAEPLEGLGHVASRGTDSDPKRTSADPFTSVWDDAVSAVKGFDDMSPLLRDEFLDKASSPRTTPAATTSCDPQPPLLPPPALGKAVDATQVASDVPQAPMPRSWSTKVEPSSTPKASQPSALRSLSMKVEASSSPREDFQDEATVLLGGTPSSATGGWGRDGLGGEGLEDLRMHLRQAITVAIEKNTLAELLRKAWDAGERGMAAEVGVAAQAEEAAPHRPLSPEQIALRSEMKELLVKAVGNGTFEKAMKQLNAPVQEDALEDTLPYPAALPSTASTRPSTAEGAWVPEATRPSTAEATRPSTAEGAWVPEVESLRSETVALRDRTAKLEAMLEKLLFDK